jgi:hypothetical protein
MRPGPNTKKNLKRRTLYFKSKTMKYPIILFIILLSGIDVFSQSHKWVTTEVTVNDRRVTKNGKTHFFTHYGYLYTIKDSTLFLMPPNNKISKSDLGIDSTIRIPASSIEKIKFPRSRFPFMGITFGGIGGVIAGSVIGYRRAYNNYKPCTDEGFLACAFDSPETDGLIGGIGGFFVGGILGAATGAIIEISIPKGESFTINGNRMTFEKHKPEFIDKAYIF